MSKIIWSLDRALSFIRGIQPQCEENGYYIALAGGVLNNGESYNDLDLVLMPKTDESSIDRIIQWLESQYGAPVVGNVPNGRWLGFAHHCLEVVIVGPPFTPDPWEKNGN